MTNPMLSIAKEIENLKYKHIDIEIGIVRL